MLQVYRLYDTDSMILLSIHLVTFCYLFYVILFQQQLRSCLSWSLPFIPEQSCPWYLDNFIRYYTLVLVALVEEKASVLLNPSL